MALITYEHKTDGVYCPNHSLENEEACGFYYEGDEPYIQSDNCALFKQTLDTDLSVRKKSKDGYVYIPLKRCQACIDKFGE